MLLVVGMLFPGCEATPGRAAKKSPPPVTESVPLLAICDATRRSVGNRVQVSGSFDGFGYATDSRLIILKANEICNERGAGLAFVELKKGYERDKLYRTEQGSHVVVEGTVTRTEEGRYVYLEKATVIDQPRRARRE